MTHHKMCHTQLAEVGSFCIGSIQSMQNMAYFVLANVL